MCIWPWQDEVFFASADFYLLHGHLGHQIKSGKVCTGKAVFVLAHLDGIQPLVHRTEAGEVRDAAVQERQMNATEDKNKDSKVTSSSQHTLFLTVVPNWANTNTTDSKIIIYLKGPLKKRVLKCRNMRLIVRAHG